MDLNEKEIVISEERKAIWQLVIAAIFYTATLYVLCLVFQYWSIRWIRVGTECLKLALILFAAGLFFSTRRIIYLNTETKILKIEYRVGNIKIDFSKISDLNYISVFKNTNADNYEINLWYKSNKHLNITCFEDLNKAIECGKLFSIKLNIDLLDATEKGNSKWIDTTNR